MSKVDKYIEEVNMRLYSPDEPFKSSPNQVERFLEDVTWNDLKMFIHDRIDILRERLETEDNINTIRMLQGSIVELKQVLIMPALMIEHIETENINKEQEGE
jgi:hypothetical protein